MPFLCKEGRRQTFKLLLLSIQMSSRRFSFLTTAETLTSFGGGAVLEAAEAKLRLPTIARLRTNGISLEYK
jgi:hypothetical protein